MVVGWRILSAFRSGTSRLALPPGQRPEQPFGQTEGEPLSKRKDEACLAHSQFWASNCVRVSQYWSLLKSCNGLVRVVGTYTLAVGIVVGIIWQGLATDLVLAVLVGVANDDGVVKTGRATSLTEALATNLLQATGVLGVDVGTFALGALVIIVEGHVQVAGDRRGHGIGQHNGAGAEQHLELMKESIEGGAVFREVICDVE